MMKVEPMPVTRQLSRIALDSPPSEVQKVQNGMVDVLPRDIILDRIYPHLQLRDLASASRVCSAMRLKVPEQQEMSSLWTVLTRAKVPAPDLPGLSRPFSELRSVYSREMLAQSNISNATPATSFSESAIFDTNGCTKKYASSSDSRRLAVPSAGGRLLVVDVASDNIYLSDAIHDGYDPMVALQWYNQDQSIAVAFQNGGIASLHLESMEWENFERSGQGAWDTMTLLASFSPDLKYLARCPGGNAYSPLQVISLDPSAPIAKIEHEFPGERCIEELKWSPLGDHFFSIDESLYSPMVRVIDAASGTIVHQVQPAEALRAADWSADGRFFASVTASGRDLKMLNLSSRSETSLALADDHYQDLESPHRDKYFTNDQMMFEPNGGRMALLIDNQGVAVYDLKHGSRWLATENRVASASWSPTGRWLAITTWNDEIKVLDADTPEKSFTPLYGAWLSSPQLAWTANGHHLVAVRQYGSNVHVMSFAPHPERIAARRPD